jgi:hypothetical protein
MKTMSFAEMAQMNKEALPEVKMLPVGHYIWQVEGAAEVKKSASGMSELINFKCVCVAPDEDFADPDALEEFGNPSGLKRTLMFTYPSSGGADEDEDSLARRQAAAINRLSEFLFKTLAMDGDNIQEALAVCNGYQFIGEVRHEADNRNPGKFQERLSATGPVA